MNLPARRRSIAAIALLALSVLVADTARAQDQPKPGGVLSCTHDDEDLERTADGLRKALRMLKEEGELSS